MRFALVFACLILGACSLLPSADRASSGGQSSFTALNDAEIESVLNGHYLDYDQGENAIGPRVRRENYCDGVMTAAGDRPPTYVTPYIIANGQLCFESTRRSCRSFHRDRSGDLHMRWHGDDGAIILTHRIDVGALPGSSCTD